MAEQPKFTPGPWRWFGNTKHDFYLATEHSGRLYVMSFERKGMRGAQPVFRGPRGTLVPASEMPIFEVCREAETADDPRVYRKDIVGFRSPDAHLMAASPCLYEAASLALDLLERVGDSRKDAPIIDALRAAIAKAEGRS
jgi:hypothetical protein